MRLCSKHFVAISTIIAINCYNNYNSSFSIYVKSLCVTLLVITVRFSERTYSVNENGGPAIPELVLSNPSATAFTVQIRDTEVTATSE